MNYSEIQAIALAILTSIITGGFVLVFVEIGNRKNRENDKNDQIITPFMHKLSSFFRFISWNSSYIIYPKDLNGYEKEFKTLVERLKRRAVISGGDYRVDSFTADELYDITFDINNVWYYHDKMNPCRLSWEESVHGTEEFISKELKEINPIYLSEKLSVDLVAKVSGDFYTDFYQPIEGQTYRHEAYQAQYHRQTKFVVSSFLYVLLVLGMMLFFKPPMLLLQLAALLAIVLLVASVMLLAVDVKKQIVWRNIITEYFNSIKKKNRNKNKKKQTKDKKRIMRKFFKVMVSNVLPKIVYIGILFALWAILSIEIPLIPKIPSCMSEATTNGLNKVFLALAYSYLAGVIVYGLTSKLPYWRKKKQLLPVIDSRISDIGSHLSKMNLEFREPGNNPDISEIDKVMALFTTKRWKEKCRIPDNLTCSNVTEAFIRDYRELQRMVGLLIHDYKNYLSTDQLLLLEKLRKDPIDQFFTTYEGSGNKFNFSDFFYEKLLLPSYLELLVTYNKLKTL
jgi:hypothetical protein